MGLIIEGTDEVKLFVKNEFDIDLDIEIDNVDNFKFGVLPKLINYAKDIGLSDFTIRKYKNNINGCDNRSRQKVKNHTFKFSKSIYNRKMKNGTI